MSSPFGKTARQFAVFGSIVWGVVELVALQRSRLRTWSMRG